jgi:hypothetical protein
MLAEATKEDLCLTSLDVVLLTQRGAVCPNLLLIHRAFPSCRLAIYVREAQTTWLILLRIDAIGRRCLAIQTTLNLPAVDVLRNGSRSTSTESLNIPAPGADFRATHVLRPDA